MDYQTLVALTAPKVPNELDYEELVKVLQTHLSPKKNVLVTQHFFLSTFQQQNQNIADFITALRRDIAECEFTSICSCGKLVSVANIFLRAQFIRGIKDSWIKEQLLQANVLSFEEIVAKAIALEASRIDSHELSKQPDHNLKNSTEQDVNKVSKQHYSNQNHSRHNSRRQQHSTGFSRKNRHHSSSRSKSKID